MVQCMTRPMLLSLLLSLSVLVGCQGERQVLHNTDTVTVASDTQPEVVDGILDAAEAWGAATGGRVALHVAIAAPPDQEAPVDGTTITTAALSDPLVGATHSSFGPVQIYVDVAKLASIGDSLRAEVRHTVMHELGHAFGLYEHEEGTLMARVTTGAEADVDARTLARWEALQ